MPATFALIKRNQKEVLVNATIRPYRHIQVICNTAIIFSDAFLKVRFLVRELSNYVFCFGY